MSESQRIDGPGIAAESQTRPRKRRGWRRLGGTATALTTCTALLLGAAGAAQADLPSEQGAYTFASPYLNVHPGDPANGPDLSQVIDQVPYSTFVVVDCQVNGPPETGPFGTTTLWDRLAGYEADGTPAWVSDAWVNTFTNGQAVDNTLC
jgi:hypothetical protein